MCKYAMTKYKDHYACFDCQKTFKRRLWIDIRKGDKENSLAICPECGGGMANMGKDFESPKQKDDKAWRHIKNLYDVGITFFSCGCTGPGYIPRDHEALLRHFEEVRGDYFKELEFWRKRIEPETKVERIKDEQRNWKKLTVVSDNYRKEVVTNQEGFDYWMERIKSVEVKIEQVKAQSTI